MSVQQSPGIHPNQIDIISSSAQSDHASLLQAPGLLNSSSGLGFQRLKVEDALTYLDQVKLKFGNQPEVYNEFLDIMKEFKTQNIDTPGVIQRVSNLFNGNADLIVGFNTFLPPGYKIEVTIEQVGTCGTQQITHTHIKGPHGVSSVQCTPRFLQSHHIASQHSYAAPPQRSAFTPTSPFNLQDSSMSSNQVIDEQVAQDSQPVEFNHAINYVNKIKNRFQGQPDTYKEFLEILHTYQKEQRNMKEIGANYRPRLTESAVYGKVARLFNGQEDLLSEFSQFLPDAPTAAHHMMLQHRQHSLEESGSPGRKPSITVKTKPACVKRISQSTPLLQKVKKARQHIVTSPLDVDIAEAGKMGNLSEFAFFDRVRRAVRNQQVYDNFLRCLVLFNNELVNRNDLINIVQPFLGKFPDLFQWFKQFLGFREMQQIEPSRLDSVIPRNHDHMEIDFDSCKKYGASYRVIPNNAVQPRCTGRTQLPKEIQQCLNDTWVSFPSWREDSTFLSTRKTHYEENIYRCEDERFELDIVLETNMSTIKSLEGVSRKLDRISNDEQIRYRLDNCLGGTSEVVHRKAIER